MRNLRSHSPMVPWSDGPSSTPRPICALGKNTEFCKVQEFTMARALDDFIPTRRRLLTRLKHWDDQESWKEFFDTYGKLIYRVATQSGLNATEAQDVVQETIISVAKRMSGFKYDPA